MGKVEWATANALVPEPPLLAKNLTKITGIDRNVLIPRAQHRFSYPQASGVSDDSPWVVTSG